MSPDLGNALFEVAGSILIWKDVHQLVLDKQIKGVYWPARAFFAAWGVWNLYYYAAIGQNLSWLAGVVMVTANIVWVALVIKYIRRNDGEFDASVGGAGS